MKNEDMLHDSGRKFYMEEISTLSIYFALINYFLLQLKLHSLRRIYILSTVRYNIIVHFTLSGFQNIRCNVVKLLTFLNIPYSHLLSNCDLNSEVVTTFSVNRFFLKNYAPYMVNI